MPETISIRPASPGDAAEIAQVNYQTWKETYRGILDDGFLEATRQEEQVKLWSELLAKPDPSQQRFVALSHGKVVGYCGGGRNADTRSPYKAELHGIYVLKEFQGQGVGTLLVEGLANWLAGNGFQSMCVWIFSRNPYKKFYGKLKAQKLEETREIDYGGVKLTVECYGWNDLGHLVNL